MRLTKITSLCSFHQNHQSWFISPKSPVLVHLTKTTSLGSSHHNMRVTRRTGFHCTYFRTYGQRTCSVAVSCHKSYLMFFTNQLHTSFLQHSPNTALYFTAWEAARLSHFSSLSRKVKTEDKLFESDFDDDK